MMRVLVTGSDGFIGSHLTEALVRAGHDVRAFTLYNSFGTRGWLDRCASDVRGKFEIIAGDVRDPFGVKESMQGCDAVMHLAALIGIPYSYQSPSSYVETNVSGTLNIVQAARDLGLQRVIHTSTSEVYGSAQFVPITEEHPLQGQSPYSASKIGADHIALSYFLSFGTPVTVVRPFNTYGPRQSARAVIPTIISQIASGNRRVKIGALGPTRDFNFVGDTVAGFMAALNSDSVNGETINIGSNYEISIRDTAKLIAELMNAEVAWVEDEQRLRPKNSEVERLWAENSKALQLMGWRPEYAGLEGLRRGLQTTIDWFTDPINLSAYKPDIYNV
jgi:NAD dependent epimerase/dehydratase